MFAAWLAAWSFPALGTAQSPYEDGRSGDVVTGVTISPSMLPRPPRGYRHRATSEADYVYPAHFDDEIDALDHVREGAWTIITDDLGVDASARVLVRIARNPEEMRAMAPVGLPPPSYASGVAYPDFGLILLTLTTHDLNDPVPNASQVLVHELSHVALHRAAGGSGVPRWFSEGVAVHHSGENGLDRIQTLYEGTSRGQLARIRRLSDEFADGAPHVDVAYAEAADIVAFLLRRHHGKDKMRRLLAAMRGGATFERALENSYYLDIRELDREWRTDLDKRHSSVPLILGGGGLWVVAMIALGLGWFRRRSRNKKTLDRWANEEAAAASFEAELRRKLEAEERERLAAIAGEAHAESHPDDRDGLTTTDRHGERHTLH